MDEPLFLMRARFIELHAALTIRFIGRDFSRLARGTQVFTAVTWCSEATEPSHGLLFLFSAGFGISTTVWCFSEITSRCTNRNGRRKTLLAPIIRLELKRSHEFISRARRKSLGVGENVTNCCVARDKKDQQEAEGIYRDKEAHKIACFIAKKMHHMSPLSSCVLACLRS